jgi:hypothetical protein
MKFRISVLHHWFSIAGTGSIAELTRVSNCRLTSAAAGPSSLEITLLSKELSKLVPKITVPPLFRPFALLENLAQPKYIADTSLDSVGGCGGCGGCDGSDGVGGGCGWVIVRRVFFGSIWLIDVALFLFNDSMNGSHCKPLFKQNVHASVPSSWMHFFLLRAQAMHLYDSLADMFTPLSARYCIAKSANPQFQVSQQRSKLHSTVILKIFIPKIVLGFHGRERKGQFCGCQFWKEP